MKNKELFERSNKDSDLELQAKLRNDYEVWCKNNGRTTLNQQSTIDWLNEEVNWHN